MAYGREYGRGRGRWDAKWNELRDEAGRWLARRPRQGPYRGGRGRPAAYGREYGWGVPVRGMYDYSLDYGATGGPETDGDIIPGYPTGESRRFETHHWSTAEPAFESRYEPEDYPFAIPGRRPRRYGGYGEGFRGPRSASTGYGGNFRPYAGGERGGGGWSRGYGGAYRGYGASLEGGYRRPGGMGRQGAGGPRGFGRGYAGEYQRHRRHDRSGW